MVAQRSRATEMRRPVQIKEMTRAALEDQLDDATVKVIVDSLVRDAKEGDRQAIDSLVRLLEFQSGVMCW